MAVTCLIPLVFCTDLVRVLLFRKAITTRAAPRFIGRLARREIARRRPLGDTRRITERDVWANIARNLPRQPAQESALAFVERAHQVRQSARRAFQITMQRIEQKLVDHKRQTTLTYRWRWRRYVAKVLQLAKTLSNWIEGRERVIPDLNQMARENLTPHALRYNYTARRA